MNGELIWQRLGALSGVAFVALFVAVATAWGDSDSPSPDDPAATIAAYLAQSSQRSDLRVALQLVGVLLFICFVGYLRDHLRRAEGGDSWLASAAFGGGVLTAGMLLVWAAIDVAANALGASGADPQVAKTLYVLSWDFLYVLGPPLAAFVGASSLVGLRHGALPRWIAWSGLLVALALLAMPITFMGFLLSLLWLLATSVGLLVRTLRVERREIAAQPA